MTSSEGQYEFYEWFRCPRCGTAGDEQYGRVQFAFGLGNASLKFSCSWCGHRIRARAWNSYNLKPSIRWFRFFKPQYLTQPLCGRELHSAAKCAACSARGHTEVKLWIESNEGVPDVAVAEVSCLDCGAESVSRIEAP
jgi:predicted RNA-binding Zn-ribbon protein involved in translation (DUF1610 family)